MLNEKLNARLIELIHQKTPAHCNPATLLAEILHIGKEAVYRRLRGEVLFSFVEAAQIAEQLHISLDHTTPDKSTSNAMFSLNFTNYQTSAKSYMGVIENDTAILHDLCKLPGSELSEAGNQLPQSLYMKYENLSNFKLFKWLHQHDMLISPILKFNDMRQWPELTTCYHNFISAVQQIDTTHYIFDRTICQHWVQAIIYFSDLNLISEQDIVIMKGEMLALLNDLENMSVTGKLPSGKRVYIYVSDLDIEANYTFVTRTDKRVARIAVYSLNSIRTEDIGMVENMDKWIHALRKFATLITQSSELQRMQFFNQQRKIIESLADRLPLQRIGVE